MRDQSNYVKPPAGSSDTLGPLATTSEVEEGAPTGNSGP